MGFSPSSSPSSSMGVNSNSISSRTSLALLLEQKTAAAAGGGAAFLSHSLGRWRQQEQKLLSTTLLYLPSRPCSLSPSHDKEDDAFLLQRKWQEKQVPIRAAFLVHEDRSGRYARSLHLLFPSFVALSDGSFDLVLCVFKGEGLRLPIC